MASAADTAVFDRTIKAFEITIYNSRHIPSLKPAGILDEFLNPFKANINYDFEESRTFIWVMNFSGKFIAWIKPAFSC